MQYVPTTNQQQFRAAASDLQDDRFRLRCLGSGHEHVSDAHVGDPVHLRFIDGFDVETGGDKNAIDESDAVGCLADRARCHHTYIFRITDTVFVQDPTKSFENRSCLLDSLPTQTTGLKCIAS